MATISGDRVRSGHALATWRVPRTRGATSGLLVMLLGAWGALVPLVGPHFGYAYTPNATWTMTGGRLWLEVVPGAVAFLAGLLLIASKHRAMGLWAGWLAALAGAWFALGQTITKLWSGGPQAGTPIASDTAHAVLEQIGMFTGLGVVIVFLGATAIGRFSVIGVRDGAVVEPEVVDTADTTMMGQQTSRMRMDTPEAQETQMTRRERRRAERDAKAANATEESETQS